MGNKKTSVFVNGTAAINGGGQAKKEFFPKTRVFVKTVFAKFTRKKDIVATAAYDEIPRQDSKTGQDAKKDQKSNNGFGGPFDDTFAQSSMQLKFNEGYFVAEETASRY